MNYACSNCGNQEGSPGMCPICHAPMMIDEGPIVDTGSGGRNVGTERFEVENGMRVHEAVPASSGTSPQSVLSHDFFIHK